MKNILLILLLLSQGSLAQKLVYLPDSTAARPYLGSTNLTNRTTTRVATAENSSETQLQRIAVATFLTKQLSAAFTVVRQFTALDAATNSIQYKAYINSNGKIDSLIYYRVTYDTSRNARAVSFRGRMAPLHEHEWRNRLEEEWRPVVNSFKTKPSDAGTRTYGGVISLRYPPKNLEEFLATHPDTVSAIHLVGFGLREFPTELKRFKKLKSINLKDNFIAGATLNKKEFPDLQSISFQNNLLQDGSLKFTGGLKPATINLTDNYYTRIPKLHRKVQQLFLANSSIARLTAKDVRQIKRIQSLNLYNNDLAFITPKIRRLKKLRELDLYRNNLTNLPSGLTRLKTLETLAVSHNQLAALPPGMASLRNLKTLYAHHNRLTALPSLPEKLEILDVGYNRLQEVPTVIRPLKQLKTLDYSYNQVRGDLSFLLQLPEIREIYLQENRYAANEEEEKEFSRVLFALISRGVTVK